MFLDISGENICLPRGRHSEAAHKKRLLCAQKCTRGGVGWGGGVGCVMQGWGGVGHVGVGWGGLCRGWGVSCRGGVCHAGVGCVIQGWGGVCHVGVGWGGVGHAGVGWVM